VRKIGYVLTVLLLAFLCASSEAAPSKADFEGNWSRTNVSRSYNAEITIKNVTGDSFEFFFEAMVGANMGELEDTAFFTAENVQELPREKELTLTGNDFIGYWAKVEGDEFLDGYRFSEDRDGTYYNNKVNIRF